MKFIQNREPPVSEDFAKLVKTSFKENQKSL
jgi:hypothetical protein